ncbi:YHS domain-containing (seleno)protein [Aureisphaera galaxeae]|uniref:YHS domain-containing (seleno)protein n=1 Tax=Aureisphaera galaxeae TaxID=1538023 RepID=UPI00234FCF72|nr:YHS domain-containing (seleno)protein [Aureisphaera galaxeae]MDC8002522.1 YHS domain-containing (seleno)protein [Aureisphaera galaxeae]
MKKIILLLGIIFMSLPVLGQDHVNLKNNYAAQGYDVVSYFQDHPQKGDKKYTHTHEGVRYRFASKENLMAFQANPDKYIPQYGGYCAYAIAKKGEKVGVNPKTYLISDEKLYLFYNSWGVNTLEKWNEEGAETLQKEADERWQDIVKMQ